MDIKIKINCEEFNIDGIVVMEDNGNVSMSNFSRSKTYVNSGMGENKKDMVKRILEKVGKIVVEEMVADKEPY